VTVSRLPDGPDVGTVIGLMAWEDNSQAIVVQIGPSALALDPADAREWATALAYLADVIETGAPTPADGWIDAESATSDTVAAATARNRRSLRQ